MREYGVIHTCFWSSNDISALSDDAKLLALYLISGPHTTMLGCFRLPFGYVQEDLGWSRERVSKGFHELFEKGFVTHDKHSQWVLIHHFIKWNRIENPNQGKQAVRLFEQIPHESCVKPILARILAEFGQHLPERFRNGLETLSQPFRNQEQEQEQDIYLLSEDLSGSPPDPAGPVEKPPPKNGHHSLLPFVKDAENVLKYLNDATDRNFQLRNPNGKLTSNAKLVVNRLKEGYTRLQLCEVVFYKAREWGSDDKMNQYLRPDTLFAQRNFEKYLGAIPPEATQ